MVRTYIENDQYVKPNQNKRCVDNTIIGINRLQIETHTDWKVGRKVSLKLQPEEVIRYVVDFVRRQLEDSRVLHFWHVSYQLFRDQRYVPYFRYVLQIDKTFD